MRVTVRAWLFARRPNERAHLWDSLHVEPEGTVVEVETIIADAVHAWSAHHDYADAVNVASHVFAALAAHNVVQLNVARARERRIGDAVTVALMHAEEVILSLPGRWDDPLVPSECGEAFRALYAAVRVPE